MDCGLLALHRSDVEAARSWFERAVASLEAAALDGIPGSDEAIERARLMHGEALAVTGELSRAENEIAEVVRGLQRRWNEGLEPDPDDLGAIARRRSLAAGLAHGFRALGTVQLLRGDVSGALIHLQEAREDWRELAGDEDGDGAAFALGLARGLRAAGRFNEVDEPLEAARLLAGGDMDRIARPELPVALHDLGVSAADRGDWAAAATLLDEATMMASSLLPREHRLRGRILYTRGLMYLADADVSRALDHLDDAARQDMEAAERALLDAARAWATAQEGAHRHLEMAGAMMDAHEALAGRRGPDSTGAAHLLLLARSLEG
jgi:tetratricopeptide (TPR) repeat protein